MVGAVRLSGAFRASVRGSAADTVLEIIESEAMARAKLRESCTGLSRQKFLRRVDRWWTGMRTLLGARAAIDSSTTFAWILFSTVLISPGGTQSFLKKEETVFQQHERSVSFFVRCLGAGASNTR